MESKWTYETTPLHEYDQVPLSIINIIIGVEMKHIYPNHRTVSLKTKAAPATVAEAHAECGPISLIIIIEQLILHCLYT